MKLLIKNSHVIRFQLYLNHYYVVQEGWKKGKSEHVVNKSKANRASQSRWETIGIPMIDDGKVVHLHHRSDVYLIAC